MFLQPLKSLSIFRLQLLQLKILDEPKFSCSLQQLLQIFEVYASSIIYKFLLYMLQ